MKRSALYSSLFSVLMFVALFGSSRLNAEAKPVKTYKQDEMNGYKLSDFPDFEKKWKLVTVRYRKDTGEMRLTYANDLAYENLAKGVTDYPEGSVFAKIGIKTVEDASFPSSAVPAGARRYQFMVRDKKKFADTEGWGYVLFSNNGIIFPEDPVVQTAACAACHRIVPERGYVFSQLWQLSASKEEAVPKKQIPYTEKIKFKDVKVSKLPELVQKEIPKQYKTAMLMDHEISKYLFQGTLDEIKPLLTEQAIKSKKPALILSSDQKTFSLVFIENLDINCEQEGKKGFFMKAVSSSPQQNNVNYENRYCWVD